MWPISRQPTSAMRWWCVHRTRMPVSALRIFVPARDMPGVRAILTFEDIADLGLMPCVVGVPGQEMIVPPCPVLARDEVFHVGDAIAFVVADTLDQARDAAEADRDRLGAAAACDRIRKPRWQKERRWCGRIGQAISLSKSLSARATTPRPLLQALRML